MNLRVASKIIFLLMALTATIFAVVQLNTGHMNDFWTSLGIGQKTHSLNWCNDRLVTLTGKSNDKDWTLKEQDRKWVIVFGETDVKNLEYLDIEKWLAKYCILDIAVFKDSSIFDMKVEPIATASFNDGSTAKMFKLGDNNLYQIDHVVFTSPEFEKGLAELKDLLKL